MDAIGQAEDVLGEDRLVIRLARLAEHGGPAVITAVGQHVWAVELPEGRVVVIGLHTHGEGVAPPPAVAQAQVQPFAPEQLVLQGGAGGRRRVGGRAAGQVLVGPPDLAFQPPAAGEVAVVAQRAGIAADPVVIVRRG